MAEKITWKPKIVVNASKRIIAKRMKGAMLVVQGEAQRKISTGQPVRRSVPRTPGGVARLVGLNPSVAPNPPHVLTGALRESITHDVQIEPNAVVGRVGTNLVYGRRLELGYSGTDSRGRNINQGERPYLRPALFENIKRVIGRLAGA